MKLEHFCLDQAIDVDIKKSRQNRNYGCWLLDRSYEHTCCHKK